MISSVSFREVRHLSVKERFPSETVEEWHARVGGPEMLFPGKLNFLVGANGSGKTTLLELIHASSDPNRFKKLLRENQPSISSFMIELCWGTGTLTVSHQRRDGSEYLLFSVGNGNEYAYNLGMEDTNEENKLKGFLRANLPFSSKYVDLSRRTANDIPLEKIRDHLCEFRGFLKGVFKGSSVSRDGIEVFNPGTDSESLGILYDTDRVQFSMLKFEDLPLGWQSIVRISDELEKLKDNEILLIEEPDSHLHPRLQRRLVEQFVRVLDKRSIQVFLTTHSPPMINAGVLLSSKNCDSIRIFRIEKKISSVQNDVSDLLIDLGARPSDVFLANGIIWVEGPSDRIYLSRWIRDYCISKNIDPLVEGIDFAFLMYGGKSAKHHSTRLKDRFNISVINQNYFVIGDNDQGEALKWNNLLDEALCSESSEEKSWLLEVKTIEDFCYPKESPVEITQKVKHSSTLTVHRDWQETVNSGINRLVNAIGKWAI